MIFHDIRLLYLPKIFYANNPHICPILMLYFIMKSPDSIIIKIHNIPNRYIISGNNPIDIAIEYCHFISYCEVSQEKMSFPIVMQTFTKGYHEITK